MKRVIEIGQIVAGPTAGLLLSDFGYEVIKIERPEIGDVSRNLTGTSSGTFPYYNRGKKSLSIDISTDKGKEILSRLIKTADIIIENMSPGSMDRLGFSYENVKKINEKIIYLSIKGYMEGPYHGRKSLDYPIEIESGLAYMTGKYGHPMRMGASIVDMVAAILGVTRIFNMIGNNEHGFVEIGLFETAMFLAGQHIATYQIEKKDLPPINEKNFAWGVYDYFMTSDNKKIFIAVSSDGQWKDFCRAFSMAPMFIGNEYMANNLRYEKRDILIPEIQKKLILMKFEDIIKILLKYNISYAAVNKPWDLLSDKQAIKYMVNVKYKNNDYTVPALPFMHAENMDAPKLGSDNYAILAELGYNVNEIDEISKENCI
ncbi:MAG: CaiB/BaiF CoA-transferase family protein [Ferroplasma sp.]